MFDLLGHDLSGIQAPKFPQGLIWLNSPPLALEQLKGKVILIDFWTYSCINCQRTLPYIREWWNKYKDSGLVIIGIHSPEFAFEKNPQNLKNALKKYQVTWPVVMDNDFETWQLYGTHAWPTKHLVDENGTIVYSHVGEGNYFETEQKIQEALKKAGFKIKKELTEELSQEIAKLGQTPELYCGYLRGILGNPEGFQKNKDYQYQLPENIEPDMVYLEGVWHSEAEYLEHPRKTEELEDILTLSYRAKKVYLVMESANGKPIKVYITLDSSGLTKEVAGEDIEFDGNGRAYVNVQFSTLYNLIETPTFGDHILKISTLDKGLRCFAFTFGS